jgi:thiamine-phosphate pyrophosphorylase
MPRPPLIAMVTDRRRYAGDEGMARTRLIDATREAASAGVDLVQIREPDLEDRQLADLTAGVVAAAAGTPCRIVVNARADIARLAGAHGVHLRGTSPPSARIRAIVPPGFLVGRSVHSADEAEAVERAGGCDYLIFGTVFPSVTKGPDHPVAGAGQLAEVCARVHLPVLAIGGVTLERAVEVATSGAAGIAAIDLFAALPIVNDPARTTESWRAAVSAIRAVFERA